VGCDSRDFAADVPHDQLVAGDDALQMIYRTLICQIALQTSKKTH
jgi:hypothetical protein